MPRTPKPRRGRPPVEGVTRGEVIPPIRCTPEELARLKAAATRAGSGLGPWLRSLGLRHAESD
jgi:hypothetical protein